MAFVRDIVIDFIQDHIRGENPSRPFEQLRKKTTVNDPDSELLRKQILHSLSNIARELEDFIKETYNDRFANLTEPLMPALKNGSKRYYESFKAVIDELFATDFSWTHIVTFLVYSAELTNKVLELSLSEDKTHKMVSQIINSICRYFDERLTQWIEKQDGGWQSLVEFDKKQKSASDNEVNTEIRSFRHYVSNVVAAAAIIGGLYLCSKLTIQ